MKTKMLFLTSLLAINTAFALPILTESMNNQGSLATLYPDHEDPKKVYFMPNRGALQEDAHGVPEFGFTYWGLKDPQNAGGFFSAILNLKIGTDLQTAINHQLSMNNKVAVLPVQSSYIDFATERGQRVMTNFFQEIDLAPYSGRAEDSFGLQATLTRTGAIAMAALLKSGAQGAKLAYCYEVTGLSPVFDARITLNYHKVYQHFLAHASFGRWWWRVNIRTEIEKLIENKDIDIVINGGTANQKDYVMALVDRMVSKFFDPILENRRNSTGGRFGISYTRIVEDRTQTFRIKEREIITRDFCLDIGLGKVKEFPHLIVNADNLQE